MESSTTWSCWPSRVRWQPESLICSSGEVWLYRLAWLGWSRFPSTGGWSHAVRVMRSCTATT